MTVVLAGEKLMSHIATRRFGVPYLYGLTTFGQAKFGDFGMFVFDSFFGNSVFGVNTFGPRYWFSGVYKRRPTHTGTTLEKIFYYRPPTNNRPAQLARRAKFKMAVQNWQVLTLPQRAVYNARAGKHSYSGYNLFIKEYMLS